MSYLLQYASQRPGSRTRRVRVDERTLLNLPGYYGDAYVRVFVEDTSGRKRQQGPRLTLRIADCTSQISLEFALGTAGERENSLFKVDTLLGALERFRDGLAAEAELAARR
jgi:hypothetical protein